MSARSVACPTCGQAAGFSAANPWRPFCSQRCRLVDLGAWADEAYRIPSEPGPEGPDTPPENDSDPVSR